MNLQRAERAVALGRLSYGYKIAIAGSLSGNATAVIIHDTLYGWTGGHFHKGAARCQQLAKGECIRFHKRLHIFSLFMAGIRQKHIYSLEHGDEYLRRTVRYKRPRRRIVLRDTRPRRNNLLFSLVLFCIFTSSVFLPTALPSTHTLLLLILFHSFIISSFSSTSSVDL